MRSPERKADGYFSVLKILPTGYFACSVAHNCPIVDACMKKIRCKRLVYVAASRVVSDESADVD